MQLFLFHRLTIKLLITKSQSLVNNISRVYFYTGAENKCQQVIVITHSEKLVLFLLYINLRFCCKSLTRTSKEERT